MTMSELELLRRLVANCPTEGAHADLEYPACGYCYEPLYRWAKDVKDSDIKHKDDCPWDAARKFVEGAGQ